MMSVKKSIKLFEIKELLDRYTDGKSICSYNEGSDLFYMWRKQQLICHLDLNEEDNKGVEHIVLTISNINDKGEMGCEYFDIGEEHSDIWKPRVRSIIQKQLYPTR